MKEFHIGDVLSVTTGRVLSPEGFAGVHGILEFMVGHGVWMLGMQEASDISKIHLLMQFPQLKDITGEDITFDNWEGWLQNKVDTFGKLLNVNPIPKDYRELA